MENVIIEENDGHDDIVSINTATQHPYDVNGDLIENNEAPYPLNYSIEAPGLERVYAFKLWHLTTITSFELVTVAPLVGDVDVITMPHTTRFSYTTDELNWTPFMEFADFAAAANIALGSNLSISVRVLVKTIRLEAEDEETGNNVEVVINFIIDRFKWNGEDRWVDTDSITRYYVPESIEMLRMLSLNRDLTSNLFNVYANYDKSLAIQKQVAKSINDMFGFWIYYFKSSSDENSKSATFKEYRLKNIVDLKKIKILIPGNKIPTNINTYSEWGIQFADEFTIHILTEIFDVAFGEGIPPVHGDYLYFPLTNRMYSVNTSNEMKKFMYKGIHYEAILTKFEDKDNIDDGQYADELLEYIELVSNGGTTLAEKNERQDVQPNYLDLRRFESVRTFMHESCRIVDHVLTFRGTEIFRNMYVTNAIEKEVIAVQYDFDAISASNVSVSTWLYFEELSDRTLSTFGNATLKLSTNKLRVQIGSTLLSLDVVVGKLYNCIVTMSNANHLATILLYEWDGTDLIQKGFEFAAILDTDDLTGLKIYGGRQMFGFLKIANRIIDETNGLQFSANPQTLTSEIKFADKITPPITQDRSLM